MSNTKCKVHVYKNKKKIKKLYVKKYMSNVVEIDISKMVRADISLLNLGHQGQVNKKVKPYL